MTIVHISKLRPVTPLAPSHLGLLRASEVAQSRTKTLRCKTCGGKICVGRCRFEKNN